MCNEQDIEQPIEITDEMLSQLKERRRQQQQKAWEQHIEEMEEGFREAAKIQQQYKEEHPEPAPIPDTPKRARSIIRTILIYGVAIILSPLLIAAAIIAGCLAMCGIGNHPFIGYFIFRNLIRRRY